MVVKTNAVPLTELDLGYLGLFLGLRVNELVMERMKRAGFRGVRESHGYLIQHLIASDRSITELARRMHVTQQAASKTVAELLRIGVLESTPGEDRRAKRIHLSAKGWKCVQFGRRARRQLEKRLVTSLGKKNYDQGKAILLVCFESLGGIQKIRSRRVRMPT